MEKGQNTNRPAPGSQIKVEPIMELKDIKAIKKLLSDRPRDLCLFTLGINTNLRASDLTSIKVSMIRNQEELVIREKKTGKDRRITLNNAVRAAVAGLLASGEYLDQDYLFKSQRADRLTVPSVNRLVKSWCQMINLRGNYGSHSLRKTFGYHQHKTFNTPLPDLMVAFNHSTQRQTLDYLCIQEKAQRDLYLHEL